MSTQAHDGLIQHTWNLAEMGLIGAPRPISPEFTITLHLLQTGYTYLV